MISYEGWDREYAANKHAYLELFDNFMQEANYEDNSELEFVLAAKTGRKHCVSVSNATDALYFSLLAQGIGPGDEVLVTDFSWISSASCVSMTGATPVFCDIDLHTYHISLDSIRRMYSDKVRAIVYPHLFGNMTETADIQNFCYEKGIAFIEDAAQSIGSSLNGVPAGSIGDCSVFSFNTNKVVAGINGGGVVLTDDKSTADYVKKLRQHGKDGDFSLLGYNSKMYVLNAQIILFRLENEDRNKRIRQDIAKKYHDSLNPLGIITQHITSGLDHNYHKFVARFSDNSERKRVKSALQAKIHYEKPLNQNSMYKKITHRSDVCESADVAANTVLSLPIHSWLTDAEIDTVINTVTKELKL